MAITLSWSPRRLQFRIVALFLGMLVVAQIASLLLIGRSIAVNARASVNAELRTGERVFEQLLQQNASSLAGAAGLLAQDYGFRQAVASNDGQTLASALANHARRINADVTVFTDTQFALKATTHEGVDLFASALRQLAGTKDGAAPHLLLLEGQLYQLVAVPVKAPVTIGWIGMAFRVHEPLLRKMRELSSIEVALLTRRSDSGRWELIQSTLGAGAIPSFQAAWLAARALEDAPPDRAGPRDLKIDLPPAASGEAGGRMLARELALGHADDPPIAAVLMRSLDDATAP